MSSPPPASPLGLPETSAPQNPDAEPKGMPLWMRLLIGLAVVAGVGLLALVIGGVQLYRAATATPPEYQALLTRLDELEASGELDAKRQELESQVAALYSDAQAAPRWRLVVTEEQLNGWLAMQLPVDFPKLQEQGIRQPRVLLVEGAATVACGVDSEAVSGVVSVSVSPMVSDEGWVGLELLSIKLGTLPLPLAMLSEAINKAAQAADATPDDLRYRWDEANGNPVLLMDLERFASSDDRLRRVDAVEVRDGELFLSGVTEPLAPATGSGPSLPSPVSSGSVSRGVVESE